MRADVEAHAVTEQAVPHLPPTGAGRSQLFSFHGLPLQGAWPGLALSSFVFPCLAFFCLALSWRALPCLGVLCLALTCLALPCLDLR